MSTKSQESPVTVSGGQKALKRIMAPIRGRIFLARIMTCLSCIAAVAPYVAIVKIGEIWLSGGTAEQAVTVVKWLIIAFTIRILLYTLALVITHFADIKLRYITRNDIIDRIASAPLGWFTDTNSGRIRKGLHDDLGQIHQLVAHAPVEMTNAVIQPLFTLIYALIIDWRLGLLTIITLPFYILLMGMQTRGMGEKTMEMDSKIGRISSTMLEFAAGISVVKAFGKTGQAHENFTRAAQEFHFFYGAWCKPLLKISATGETIVSTPLLVFINLGGGALMVMAGWVNPVQVMATTLIALLMPRTVITFANVSWSYQLAGAAAYRVVNLLDTTQLPEATTGSLPENNLVKFNHVTFSYLNSGDGNLGREKSDPAVKDLTFTLPEGTVTALVGASGSGKSTAASILVRFFDPDHGSVTIGGVDLRDISTSDLYRRVAFVLQNPQLLVASIADNIALGKPNATREEIEAAAKVANIHDDIQGLAKGYDTLYGVDTKLSGGQKQRIAIARAMLVNAPILVLDEATAYADPENEAIIQQALSALAKDKTVLVIGHKPEVIKGADQIIVIEKGSVLAIGTHEEVSNNPYYSYLIQQSSARQELS